MTDSHLLEVGSWLWVAEHYLYIIHFKVTVVSVHQLYCPPLPTVLSSSMRYAPEEQLCLFLTSLSGRPLCRPQSLGEPSAHESGVSERGNLH